MSEFEDKVNSILNDPQQMEKIAGLAKSLMGGDGESVAAPVQDNSMASMFSSLVGGEDSGIDLGKIGRLLGSVNKGNDEKQALFNAMKPYLSEKRQQKMDKAIKIARLASIARLAMGEMGDKDV